MFAYTKQLEVMTIPNKTDMERISNMLIVCMWLRDNIRLLPNTSLMKELKQCNHEAQKAVNGLAYSLAVIESASDKAVNRFDGKSKELADLKATADEAMQEVFKATFIIDTAMRASYLIGNSKHAAFSIDVLGLIGKYIQVPAISKLEMRAEIEAAHKEALKSDPSISYQSFEAGYIYAHRKLLSDGE